LLDQIDGLILPGGHKREGMRRYLEDVHLQRFVGRFVATGKPVGAICHGTVVLARSTLGGKGRAAGMAAQERTWTSDTSDAPDADEGSATDFSGAASISCLAGRRVTGLTKPLEMAAWTLTAWKLGRYYRTYDVTVEDEVKAAAEEKDGGSFDRGPGGIFASYDDPFTVVDGNLVTARWPGDAAKFAEDFLALLVANTGHDGADADGDSAE
jgi:putative intracellular protease/amidase